MTVRSLGRGVSVAVVTAAALAVSQVLAVAVEAWQALRDDPTPPE